MPASNPRLYLTLKPATYLAVRSLARATGKPLATVIREFLDEAGPALSHLASIAESLNDMDTETREKLGVTLARHMASATFVGDGIRHDLATTATKARRAARTRTRERSEPSRRRYPVQ